MINEGYAKVHCTNPATTQASNATTSTRIDTIGYDYLVLTGVAPPAAATNSSAKWRVFDVYQADITTFATTDAVIVGTTNTTAAATEFVMGVHNDTTEANIVKVGVDLRGRERYLFVEWGAPGATDYTTNVIVSELFRAEEQPTTAALSNLSAWTHV